jgi:hypothetical protein
MRIDLINAQWTNGREEDDSGNKFRPAAGFPRRITGVMQLPISSFDVATACYRVSGLGWLGTPKLALLPRSVCASLVERGLSSL